MAAVTGAYDVAREDAERAAEPIAWVGCSVRIAWNLSQLEGDWRALERHETASVFQSWGYIHTWCAQAAVASGETPVFVVGRRGGDARFILPMALTTRAGVQVLTWLGQSHSNYGMGIFCPELLAELQAGDVDELVIEVARRLGAAVVHLEHQPARWAGHDSPLAASACSLVTANDTFVVTLGEDFQAQYRRLFSGRTQSGLKRKQRKLEEMGAVSFAQPVGATARRAVIDWFVEHKRAQLLQDGSKSPFDSPTIRNLYDVLAGDEAKFEIDQLTVDVGLVAMGMTVFEGKTAYLVNMVHAGAEYARCSPGALLLHRMVAQAHKRGARTYDFGPGVLSYKLEWEPEVVPLLATTFLVKPSGLHVHAAYVFGVLAKAKIKRSVQLSRMARAIRRWIA